MNVKLSLTDFEFLYAPLLFHQKYGENYPVLASSRRANYGTIEFDQVLIRYYQLIDCESLFFTYSNTEFEFRCHERLCDMEIMNIYDGKYKMNSKDFFLMIFGSIYGINFQNNMEFSESTLEEACQLLIVNNIHGS